MFPTPLVVDGAEPQRTNLQRLVWLRYVLVVAAVAGLAAASIWWSPLPSVVTVLWVIGILAAINVATQLRLRSTAPVNNGELFVQLLADVALWSILLAWSGAPHSPLGSFYLLPIVIAAVTLPRRLTWCIALLSIASYSYLYYRYVQ